MITTRWMPISAAAFLCAASWAQQTPPVQPKTVDTPKLAPLILPGLPKQGEVVANAPLSAGEAVRIALGHQPQIAISKANADLLHGATLQTQSLLNPNFVATADATKAQQFGHSNGLVGGVSTQMSGQVAVNQLIFDFNKTRDQVRQSQATERAGYRNYDQVLQDVALQVKQDFYAYVQAVGQTNVQESNVKSRQAQVDLTQAQLNAGLGAPADLVNAKTLLAQGTLTLLQIRQNETAAKLRLTTEMGIDPRTPLNIGQSVETDVALPSDLNTFVDLGLKQRPTILAAQETLRAAGYGVSVARKTDTPSFNAQAGFSTAGSDNPFDKRIGFIALTMNWTFIDNGLQLGRVREAEASRTAAAQALRQASQNVISDVSNAVVGVQSARQQVPIANAEVANAQEGVRLAEGRYRAGVTTFLEVITAQANLVTAENDQVNAIANLAMALANLDHAIGKWPLS